MVESGGGAKTIVGNLIKQPPFLSASRPVNRPEQAHNAASEQRHDKVFGLCNRAV